jgi:hypothetical protein
MLGLVTVADGVAYDAFGVLIHPIREDTGWSATALAGSSTAPAHGRCSSSAVSPARRGRR